MANDTLNRSYTTIAHNERATAPFDRQQFHLPKTPLERRMQQKPIQQETQQGAVAQDPQLDNARQTVLSQFETREQPVFSAELMTQYAGYAGQIGGLVEQWRKHYGTK